MTSVFDPAFDDLPPEIPIFPLAGVLLLPQGKLPLNIFEPRYLNMTTTALGGSRLIGMVQPNETKVGEQPNVYRTGCAGRITAFSETEDGRYLITLNGVCRFNITQELPLTEGYRLVVPEWGPYRGDLTEEDARRIDRDRILATLKNYFSSNQIEVNWGAIKDTPTDRLINAIAMMCPFQPSEKQALLEATNLYERAGIMITLLEMSLAANDDTTHLRRN